MVDMKPTYILMACFMLTGSLSALTYVGAVPLKEGWNVNVYFTETPYWIEDGMNTWKTVAGRYFLGFGNSPGYIVLDGTMNPRSIAATFTHEVCHARQQMEGRAQNEKECYERAIT